MIPGTTYRSGEPDMLTDTRCRNAKPKDRPYKLTDGKGLYLGSSPTA